ncbi:MAG: PepSY domain-containing protein [Anaerovoracaceae bacterium]
MDTNKKNIGVIIAVCGVLIAALAFGTVMVAKNAMADKATYISESKAKEIVLADAKVNVNDATFTKVVLDKSERTPDYEVEFYTKTKEFDYELDAATGEIISSSVGRNDIVTGDQNNNTSDSGSYIGVDKAKKIALANVGLSESNVRFQKASLVRDDGVYVYDIEFYKGNVEYEFEINAATGAIIDKDIDRDNDKYYGNGGNGNGGNPGNGNGGNGNGGNGQGYHHDDDCSGKCNGNCNYYDDDDDDDDDDDEDND